MHHPTFGKLKLFQLDFCYHIIEKLKGLLSFLQCCRKQLPVADNDSDHKGVDLLPQEYFLNDMEVGYGDP
jgi:hypothetical protein